MSKWYCFKCCRCGHIQTKEIRVDITRAYFNCQKCLKNIKIYDARTGKIKMDYKEARDCNVASEICKVWKISEMMGK